MPHLNHIYEKILSDKNLHQYLSIWRFKQYKVVFTNGCFDILHKGHIEYLAKAKSMGDLLVVGLNTDDSVRILKGETRPLQDQDSRALLLASLKFVDHIVFFDQDTPYELIKKIQPDILVKGSDYEPDEIVGYDIVRAKGGKVKTIKYIEGFSSSSIIEKIKRNL